jgi:addiction module RelE/StbE family toxin
VAVTFSRLALADLVRIRSYVGAFNPAAANRMASRLLAVAEDLAEHPLIGRATGRGRRELTIVPPYVLVYRVDGAHVRVLRIWHGAQDRLTK